MKTSLLTIISSLCFLFLLSTTTQQAMGASKSDGKLFRFPTEHVSQLQMRTWNSENAKRSKGNGLPSNTILTLKKSKNQLYIGLPSGLSKYNTKTRNLKTYTAADHLAENLVATIGLDAEGILWVGGANSISKIVGEKIYDYSQKTLFEDIRALSAYQHPNGDLWIITADGLFIKDTQNKWQIKKEAIPGSLSDIVVDNNGNIWAAGNAIYFFDLEQWGMKSLKKKRWDTYLPLDANQINVTAMAVDEKNTLWVGTADRGFFTYNITTQKWTHNSSTIPDVITNIKTGPNGDIWVGTNKGLWKRENGVWLKLGEQNNVPEEYITALLVEDEDVWIGTHHGLIRLQKLFVEKLTTDGVKKHRLTLDQKQQSQLKKAEAIGKNADVKAEKARQEQINADLGETFTDLQRDDRYWIRDVVIPLQEKGVFQAKEFFNPEAETLWEQLIKMASIGAKRSTNSYPTDFAPSARVPQDNWSIPYLWGAVKDKNIEQEDINTYFETPVKRYQALEILFKFFDIEPLKKFTEPEPEEEASKKSDTASTTAGPAPNESNTTAQRPELIEGNPASAGAESASETTTVPTTTAEPEPAPPKTQFADIAESQIPIVETAVEYGFVKGYQEQQQTTIKAGEKYRIINRLLSSGSKGSNVEEVQKALRDLGFYKGLINGIYSQATINAMADYQYSRSIFTRAQANDGLAEGLGAFGTKTRAILQNELISTGVTSEFKQLFKPNNIFNRAQMAIVLKKMIEWKFGD